MPGSGRSDIPWRDVVDASICGAGIVEGGTLTHANERLAALLGHGTPGDLVGESWTALVAPPDRERVAHDVLPRVRENGRWEGTIRGRLIDGDERLLDLSVRRIGADAFFWSVGRAALGPSAPDPNAVRRPLDTEPVPMGICSADGEVRYCNREAVDFLGADDRNQVLGEDVGRFVRTERRRVVQERLHRTIEEREPTGSTVERVIGLDGQERVAEIETTPVTLDGEVAVRVVLKDVTEHVERERELERYETIIETVEDGVYATDEDLRFTFVNDSFCSLVGLPREDILGTHGAELYVDEGEFDEADALRERLLEIGDRTGTIRGTYPTSAGDRIFESRYRLYPEPDDEFRGSVGVVRDVTEREERQRVLERQRDELAALNRINELLIDIVNELVETATREAVERTVCERLAESDLYRFAWTGERELDGEGVEPRNSTWVDGGYLESITLDAGGVVPGVGPAGRAIQTGEPQTVNVESLDDDPLRAAASEHGLRSILAVPLRFRETMFGVLVVCATRPDAFSEREQHAFAVLGETVGYAINAINRRRLLFADAVTEIELRITAPQSFLSRVSQQLGCRLTVSGHVSANDRWILYVDVEGASTARIAEAAADDPSIDRLRIIAADDERDRLELVAADGSLVHRITSLGVGVRSLEFEDGVGRLVVEGPSDTDVRDLVEQFDGTLGSAELLALKELDRRPETPLHPGKQTESLTDRQRQVIEAAYRAGYFARPRTSTGEEVAESLGINTSTFHAHLRKAEQSFISSMFG